MNSRDYQGINFSTICVFAILIISFCLYPTQAFQSRNSVPSQSQSSGLASKSASRSHTSKLGNSAKAAGIWRAKASRTSGSDIPIQPIADHDQGSAAELRQLKIYPAEIVLAGPRASQRVVVEGEFSDGHQEDLTSQVKISASNPQVISIDEHGFVKPVSDGAADLAVSFQGRRAAAPAEVKESSAPVVFGFRNQVLPVMTKMGCNSGACHGAAAGKNGFKLTLRGYDPEVDYYTLTHQALARRTERLEPAKSLILLKPTLTIAHGGGQRFTVASPEYQVISGWIAAGMPPPKESDARVQSVEVLPSEVSLRAGADQQLLVRATFSDGHSEDVTRWAKFSSGDDGVATVDDSGRVKMRGYGEAPVTVWYLSRVSFARLSVPFPVRLDASVFTQAPRHNYIDDLVLKKLATLHIPPSRPATDAEFLRRAYLDAAGILPTAAEAERFLADAAPDKRARLIDELMQRSEFVDYWTYKWSDLLLVSSERLAPPDMWSFYNWIHASVAANKPWNKFVYEIVTSTGDTQENGAANYYAIHREPTDISENVTKAFLGMSITCAHCHNHPLDKWTQKEYYQMANLFARVRLKTSGPGGGRHSLGDVEVISSPTGDIDFPRLGRPLPPKPLDADAEPLDSPADRRIYFGEWLTSPKNPFFARALVNRVWKNFMGRGLVESVDDMRATNPPTNQVLFDALVGDFVDHGFDVQHLIKTIMNSATYQTAAEPRKENAQDEKYYSHYILRRLPAEVLLDALSQVTQAPSKFDGYPAGMRAVQLPDTKVDSYFLTVFGRPAREQTNESERQSDPSITQALHIINGDSLNDKLRAPGGTVDMLAKLGLSDARVIDYLYLSAFSRYPTDAERRGLLDHLQAAEGKNTAGTAPAEARQSALRDFTWAMLTSNEFVFDH